jgi:hypothetical protein
MRDDARNYHSAEGGLTVVAIVILLGMYPMSCRALVPVAELLDVGVARDRSPLVGAAHRAVGTSLFPT